MILETLKKEMISAMKAKESLRLSVVRYLISEINSVAIDVRAEGRELTDEDALLVLKRQVKKRNKSIEAIAKGGREDLVADEKAELEIVEEYYNKFNDSNE